MPAADFLLEHMSRTLWDPVDPSSVASLDRDLRARVNGEVYRFARPATRDRFRRDPVRWCGVLRDAVSGVRFVPGPRSPRLVHKDVPYFFASDSTLDEFRRNPERYAIHRPY